VRRVLGVLVTATLLAGCGAQAPVPPRPAEPLVAPPPEEIAQTRVLGPSARPASRAVGRPNDGRLINGVPFPPQGESFVTWDPITRRSPSRFWRRYATMETVSRVLRVLDEFHRANPGAPRVLVGDLSRPRGGVFDRRFGGLGHASHQNGLDADVYYPRRDRALVSPRAPRDVDRRLAQELVDRFVAAGAEFVFVGPSLRLRGPRGVVMPLRYHDDHLHVRFRP